MSKMKGKGPGVKAGTDHDKLTKWENVEESGEFFRITAVTASPLDDPIVVVGACREGSAAQWIEHQTLNTWMSARRGLESDWC